MNLILFKPKILIIEKDFKKKEAMISITVFSIERFDTIFFLKNAQKHFLHYVYINFLCTLYLSKDIHFLKIFAN